MAGKPAALSLAETEDTVTLVSSDGREFIVDRKAAFVSGTIKAMLEGGTGATFQEAQSKKVVFKEISGDVLEKVCQYFYYKLKYAAANTDVPEFDLDPQMALNLMMAASFLDC